MYQNETEYYSGSGFKESGIMKKWKEKLFIFYVNTQVLQIQDVKDQRQKQIRIYDYTLKRLGRIQDKYVIKLWTKSNEIKFGWNNEKEYQQWTDCFSGEWQKKLAQRKALEEFDRSLPEEEPQIDKQPLTIKSQAKPSLLSRNKIQKMIPHLPDCIQKDMEILLQSTFQNLVNFSDIHNFKQILDQEDAQLYQDTNDNLHMKLIYYSKIEPHRIYDEHVMPSPSWLPHLFKSFQVYPTKKGCSLVYAQLHLDETSCDTLQHQDLPINMMNSDLISIVFTQKGFEKDGIYCIFRKYTGQEIYHDQIDHSLAKQLDQYKIIRSVLVIQPSNKQDYKSLLIEDINVESQDRDAGEKMIKVFLMNITSSDRNLTQIQEQIQQITENIITQNNESVDALQVSIKPTKQEILRITSEQHQIQSREEFLKIIEMVKRGEQINEAITYYSDQRISQGLSEQLDSTEEGGHFMYTKYYRVDQQRGGLTYHNERLLRDQRSVLLSMIKRIGSNIINGKSVMSVSLPIQIFETRSFLERMARALGHAPIFLESAAKSPDVKEQMRLTIAFYFSGFMMGIQQEKPFNPILGETFQGRIKGCPIYLEQTSHHPPISNFILFGRDYKVYGAFSPVVNMGCNSLSGEQQGHSVVHFQNSNLKFYYINQPFTVYNIITGQRNVNCHKRSFCFQPDLQLCAVIQFNPKDKNRSFFSKSSQPIDYFVGQIHKVTPMCIERCKLAHRTGSGLNSKLKIKAEEILESYEQITGRWTSHLDVNNQRYWDINVHRPYILEFESKPLPSDCLYRLDLLLMKGREIERAQDMKEQMEVEQRRDQKLRERRQF